MKSEDDPEARIRELERPLTNQAQASELGGGQYNSGGTYVPPPAPAYNAPDYSTQAYGNTQPYGSTQPYGTQPYGAQPYGTYPHPAAKGVRGHSVVGVRSDRGRPGGHRRGRHRLHDEDGWLHDFR